MDTLGEKIKYLRTQADMTQDELAQKLGVARATIASWERNRRQPDYDFLRKLAKIFDVTTDYLLNHNSDDQLSRYPELLQLWREVSQNPDLLLIIKRIRGLSDIDIRMIARFISTERKEEAGEIES